MDTPGPPLARFPSLAIGEAPWRAARAAATVGALADGLVAPDSALDALTALGVPHGGWWDIVAGMRRAGVCVLRLPRPGDARGLALPRDAAADAALGWAAAGGASAWLVPGRAGSWTRHDLPAGALGVRDPAEADQRLRGEVVRAAHVTDALSPAIGDGDERRSLERVVDSWILGPPAMPAERRVLASTGLRILLALGHVEQGPVGVDASGLERAARDAVESAYSTDSRNG